MPRRSCGEPVVEERHRDVAVVHDRGLDLVDQLDRGRAGEVLGRQARRLAGGGVVLGDREVEAARRVVGVGLAEAERTPLGVAEPGPALRVVGQRGQVGEPDRLLGVAERLGHRLGHGDDERREHERRAGRGQRGAGALVDDAGPPGGGRRPDHRRGAVLLGVGPARGDQAGGQPGGDAARSHDDAPAADVGEVAGVELLGEVGEEGDLLAADGHVDDDAVAGVGLVDRRRVGGVTVVARGAVVVGRAGGGDHGERHAEDEGGALHVASRQSWRRPSIVIAEGAAGGVAAGGCQPLSVNADSIVEQQICVRHRACDHSLDDHRSAQGT